MSKQDRQGVRTAQDLERKYDFSSLSKGGRDSAAYSALVQMLSQYMSSNNLKMEEMERRLTEMETDFPSISVEDIENGHRITISTGEEPVSIDLLNGHTPEKGVDYFTEEDIAVIVDAIMANMADYIIETGTTDGWDWEKWNSGKYVCRGIFTEKCTNYATVNSFYAYVSSELPYPIEFTEPPIIQYNCRVGTGFSIPAGDVSHKSTFAKCYALSNGSGEKDCVWEIEAVGKWKAEEAEDSTT